MTRRDQQAERFTLVGGGRADPLLRQAFDLATDGIAVLDASGPLARIVLANDTLAKSLGTSGSALPGNPLQSWIVPAHAAEVQQAIAAVAAGDGPRRIEFGLLMADGGAWWVQALLRRLEDDTGTRVVASFTDLSERKAIEDAAGSLPVDVVGLDRQLKITWVNAMALRGFERPLAELIGRDWFEVFPELGSRRGIYERVLDGESFDFEHIEISTPSGQRLVRASSLRPIRGPRGGVTGVLVMSRDVGALYQAQAERTQAQRRLAVLMEKTQDVVTVLSRDGVISFMSPSIQRLAGYEAEELVGRNVFEFMHPDDLPDLQQRFAAHLANPYRVVPDPAEARFRHKGGGWSWFDMVATNAFDDPAVQGLVLFARSIDRRKAAEAEIAANRALLDFSLDAANIGAWDYDVLTGVHRFDARCRQLIGGLPEASTVPLETLAALTHPDDLARSRAALLRHIRGETPWYEIEYRARVVDGPWHWVYARGRVTARLADGRVSRISGVMMGIEERRRAEIELRDSQSRLETALWGGDIGFWTQDLLTGEWTVSDSWLAMTGYSREEWAGRGRPWLDHVHPDDMPAAMQELQRFHGGGRETLEVEFRLQVKCGDWIWVLMRARARERDAAGRPVQVLGTCIDITASKKMREFLEETQAAAHVGGWELNLRTQQLTWTAETYALFETSPAEYTPSMATAFDLYDTSCHAGMQAAMTKAIQDGEPFDIEVQARSLQGRQMWLRLVGKPERAGGQTVRLFGAKQDITALKAAEQALGAALAVQRAVTDNAPDWLILVDPQLRVQYANRGMRGLTAAAAVGRNGLDLLDPSVRELLRAACERALVEQAPQYAETHETMPWGEKVHLEYSAAPVVQDGKSIGLSVRATNVTRRKQAEQQLLTQARVLETMREGVVLFGPGGDIRVANPAVGRLFGQATDALLGAPVARLGVPAKALGRLGPGGDADGTGDSVSREWLAHRADGTEFLVEGVFSRVVFGGERMIIGVLQDVTDRRQLERAIIETSSFEQQRIASDLHDGLGQELTGIALLLRSALNRLSADPEEARGLLREAGTLVDGAAQSARALAHGLTPVALELGGLPGALSDLAQRVRRTFGIRAQFRKHVTTPLRLDTTQASHLYRIAQEGVNNAVRHGRATFITLRLVGDEDAVKLEIIDNGSGMPSPTQRSAVGMGLRIMEYRARMLGGEISILAPRRGGTAITCRVPLAVPRPVDDGQP